MSPRADSCGHLSIWPRLNPAEHEYLSAFVQSRRHAARSHPYEVPDNPAAEVMRVIPAEDGGPPRIEDPSEGCDRDAYNEPAAGQPSLWCPWVASCRGECLSLDTDEKINAPLAWLQYLIDHFLKPGAVSASSGRADFSGFTYDHQVTGAIALHCTETNELLLVRVVDDLVIREIVNSGESNLVTWR